MAKNTLTFDWTLIRSFVAVLDAGSLMGAARKTGAMQPTLSRHISELEAQLGVPLFERTGRGVVPTAAALGIADAAREMEGGALALRQALETQRNQKDGTVRLSASQVVASAVMPRVLAEFSEAEPGIQIELVASDVVTNLLRREADIAVRMIRPEQTSLIAKKLIDVPLVACAHRAYLDRAGTPRRTADLLNHRLIGNDRSNAIIRGFAAMGYTVNKDHFAFRSDDHVVTGQLIAAGCGIGFAARYHMQQWPGVVPILPMLKLPTLPCWLAVHREIRSNRVVRRTYDFLAARLPELLS
jgi:DNA-binding transcriptional LysR family regulator